MLLSTGEQVSVALMAMAIHSLGHKAVSLTGAQIGIKTDSTHTKARIQSIATDRMRQAARRGQHRHRRRLSGDRRRFQHHHARPRRQRHDGGRPGRRAAGRRLRDLHRRRRRLHDRSAACCPRPAACSRISYDEMLELASLGAGVMHSRSIEFGKKFDVPIHVRSSFTDMPGTMIVAEPEPPDLPVSGAALAEGRSPRSPIAGRARPAGHEPGDFLARSRPANIAVDMIVQNVGDDGQGRHLVHRAARTSCRPTLEAVQEAAAELGAEGVTHDDSVAKVSVVGLGMAKQTGVAQKMFRALADAGINIQMITTSEIKISVLVASRPGRTGAAGRASGVSSWRTSPHGSRERATAEATNGRNGTTPLDVVAPAAGHGRPDDRRHRARRDRRPA